MDGTIRTKSFNVDRASYLKAMWSRGLWKRLATIGGCYAVLLLAVYALLGPPGVLGAAPPLVLVLLGVVPLRYALARRAVYGKSGYRIFDDARTIEFSVEGLRIRTEGGVLSQVPWSHIERTEHRGGFTFLFMTKILHYIVPDDAFASAGDREAFEVLLRTRGLAVSGKH